MKDLHRKNLLLQEEELNISCRRTFQSARQETGTFRRVNIFRYRTIVFFLHLFLTSFRYDLFSVCVAQLCLCFRHGLTVTYSGVFVLENEESQFGGALRVGEPGQRIS